MGKLIIKNIEDVEGAEDVKDVRLGYFRSFIGISQVYVGVLGVLMTFMMSVYIYRLCLSSRPTNSIFSLLYAFHLFSAILALLNRLSLMQAPYPKR